ncbi:MAG: ATP-binding protein [Myxococcales bacterium]|nr:ATP-binding protein [Myxococcales bacterium]
MFEALDLAPSNLVTHAVVTGMTGSGKTGLLFVLVEEVLRRDVPVLMVDIKGDLANLLLTFDLGDRASIERWHAGESALSPDGRDPIADACEARDLGLAQAGITNDDIAAFRDRIRVRVLTPGSNAGEPVHLLSSLEQRSPLWDGAPSDIEVARNALASAVSLVLRLLGRDADPASSREHVLLCVFAERRLRAGQSADLASLIADLDAPPVTEVGAMKIDRFFSKKERNTLAAALNALIASPSFASWREGVALDVRQWFTRERDGRTPAVIVSVAHLDESERGLVLGLLFDELRAYVLSLPGANTLRALLVVDEVYGMLPPHPANPPTKRPLIALMKQSRAFGVGLVLATQNPMDVDYRALSNAGLWCIGRLLTDADRERVVDGLASADGGVGDGASKKSVHDVLKRLGKRWFLVRNVHDATRGLSVAQPRHTISWLRGPLTRSELGEVIAKRDG